MGRLHRYPIAASFFLGLILTGSGLSSDPPEPELKIRVLLFNYAESPGPELASATGFAADVFRNAGIEIHWADAAEVARNHGEKRPLEDSTFVMRIVPNSMVQRLAEGHDTVGFALVPAAGKAGLIAGAYYERAREVARRLNCNIEVVLGYVIAHELGHLFLGPRSHFHSGIMSHNIEGETMLLASQGRLRFTSAQARKIRARLNKRGRDARIARAGQ